MNPSHNEIELLQQQLTEDIYDLSKYDRLIQLLRLKQDWVLLQHVRKQKLCLAAYTTAEITNWLDDLLLAGDSSLILEFYSLIIKDRPTAGYWHKYLEYCINLPGFDPAKLKELFATALDDVVHDFKTGNMVWLLLLQYYTDIYEKTKSDDDLQFLLSLHKKRLSYPHEGLDDSFSQFSKFVSNHIASDQYNNYMIPANKVFSSTKKKMRYFEEFEIKLANQPDDPEIWIHYMEAVNKYSKKSEYKNVGSIFERAVETLKQDCIQIWMAYCYILYSKEVATADLELFLVRFVRSFPNSPISYAEYIRNCSDVEVYLAMRSRVDSLDLMNNSSYDQWKVLALSILNFDRVVVLNDIEFVSQLYQDLLKFVDFSISENNDVFHSVEKMTVAIFQELEDVQQAEKVVSSMIAKFASQSELWIYAINFYKTNFDYEKVHGVFLEALSIANELDWPERVIEEWLQFEQLHGSLSTYKQAIILANNKMKEISQNRAQELKNHNDHTKKREYEDESEIVKDLKKQKLEEPPQRSRETFSVKVTNLPDSITEDKLKRFFGECGTIREIILIDDSPKIAAIEFSNEQEVFSALTKNFKKIESNNITVMRLLESTLFVNNFPSSYSQEQVREMFEKIGTVVSVRFPSQKQGHHTRRFCYVEYSDGKLAQEAITMYDGKELVDDITNKKVVLSVQISNPTKKKARDAKMSEKKIRVSNLPFETTENDIREIFKNFNVEQITIPQINRKRPSDHFNDGVAIVMLLKADDVPNAITEVNGMTVGSRKIQVAKTEAKPHAQHLHEFDDRRTVGITNVDKTIGSEQLKAYFENKNFTVSKVEIFPQQEAALVEFKEISSSGQVSMLEPHELSNKVLRIVLKQDVMAIISGKGMEKPREKMIPPNLLRRRRR